MRHDALGAPHVSTDTVCTLPDHRCYDKRRWQHVTSSEASVLVRPQALRRWNESTPFFRAVFWVLLYPLFPAYHRTYGPHYFLIGLFRTAKCMCTMGQAVAAQPGIGHTCRRNSGAQAPVCPCPTIPLSGGATRWLLSPRHP